MASAACYFALALTPLAMAQAAAEPKPAWNAQQGAQATPVWPIAALPADLKPLGMERLDTLKIGMHQDEVGRALGTPHSAVIASAAAGEVWQYVVFDAADGRAFVVSLWFDHRGLWMVSARSNPVGRLATMQFVTAPAAPAPAPAAAPAAPPPVVAAVAPPPAPVTPPPPKPVPAATLPAPAVITPAPPPPPPAAPTQAEAPPAAPSPASPESALRDAVDEWLSAWRQKDAAAYIARYTADFAPPGKKHEAWAGERRERLVQPVFIRVVLADVQVHDAQGAHPKVSFVQEYESERYSEKSRKVLTFVKQGGNWLIEKEENAKLAR